jgi:hypothetical protein
VRLKAVLLGLHVADELELELIQTHMAQKLMDTRRLTWRLGELMQPCCLLSWAGLGITKCDTQTDKAK